MANRDFFYFYAPTWDFPPDGPIQLGNVLTSLAKPERPLCCNPPAAPDSPSLLRTTKTHVEYTKEKVKSGKFALLTKFLSVLGVGVDISYEAEYRLVGPVITSYHPLRSQLRLTLFSTDETFVFETIETTHFVPTPEYLQACVDQDRVVRYLQASRYRKPVYIITGTKVVKGAQANTLKSHSRGAALDISVDGTVWSGGAVPIGGGPGVKGKVAGKAGTKWEGSSDFVFAFRVSRVHVAKDTAQVSREEDYRKAAMMDKANEALEHIQQPQQSIIGVDQLDTDLEGYDVEELMDGDDQVHCAILREHDESSDK